MNYLEKAFFYTKGEYKTPTNVLKIIEKEKLNFLIINPPFNLKRYE